MSDSDSEKSVQAAPQRAFSLGTTLAQLPWWGIIIIFGLVLAIYSLLTIPVYHDALLSVSDNPQLTTNRILDVSYNIKSADGTTKTISGTLIDQNNDSATILVQDEQKTVVPREDIGKLTCDDKPADVCPPGTKKVTISRKSISGVLVFEKQGAYDLQTDFGPEEALKIATQNDTLVGTFSSDVVVASKTANIESVDDQIAITDKSGTTHFMNKNDIAKVTCDKDLCDRTTTVTVLFRVVERKPAGCSADPNGTCSIQLALNPDRDENQLTGIPIASDSGTITVQTVPPLTQVVKKTDIVKTVKSEPAQCAVNNIIACRVGIFLTIWLTLSAFGLALLLGLAFGLMRVSANPVLFNVSTLYVEVVRGIPLLVILLFTGFVIEPWYHQNFETVGPWVAVVVGVLAVVIAAAFGIGRAKRFRTEPAEVLQPVLFALVLGGLLAILVLFLSANPINDAGLRAIVSGIVGLAIGYGAYLAELFRAGIQSIGRGQMEAARSLGMTYVQAMRFVILPQAFRVILPPLGNDFIAMLKDTSLVAILAVPELTQQARIHASNTYRPFQTYITIGVLYLCMTLFLSLIVRFIERRTSYGR